MSRAFDVFTTLLTFWKQDPRILAVIGLGSLARPHRMDTYSDLDFFLIVETTSKVDFLQDPSWLHLHDNGYCFRNTNDGFKAFTLDQVFVECAVFTLDELPSIPYDQPTLYYLKEGVDAALIPRKIKTIEPIDRRFCFEECISQLYVGLGRYLRGEVFAACTMIQTYALENYLKATLPQWPSAIEQDPFVYTRRLEVAHPESNAVLASVVLGYLHTLKSAEVLFEFVKKHMGVHPLYPSIEAYLNKGSIQS